MNVMKKFYLLGLAFLASFAVEAKSLVITLSDGSLVYYLLSNDNAPMMRRVEGGFMVNGDTYAFRDVKNFYISTSDDPTDINKDGKFTLDDVAALVQKYLESPTKVKDYDVDGDGKLTLGDVTTLLETYVKQLKGKE